MAGRSPVDARDGLGQTVGVSDRPLPYTEFYCEENAWHLAQHARVRERKPHVVFATNAGRQCALWCQRAAGAPGAMVVWDYHVFVVARGEPPDAMWHVWDPDSTLGCPTDANGYIARTFPRDVTPAFVPRFRVIDAATYVATFSSDRRHMRRPDGTWSAPPPDYPAITRDGVDSNLDAFLAMDVPFVGDVMDTLALARRFGR